MEYPSLLVQLVRSSDCSIRGIYISYCVCGMHGCMNELYIKKKFCFLVYDKEDLCFSS